MPLTTENRPAGGQKMLLIDALPELAKELSTLLIDAGRTDLAEQIPKLPIVDRCRCGDHYCASIYVVPEPKGSWGTPLEIVHLDGWIILDVVDKKIAYIEVLFRSHLRRKLLDLLP